MKHISITLSLLLCLLSVAEVAEASTLPTKYSYIVHAVYPHSTTSYTQGLEIVDGVMYEGTGNYGESRLMIVDMKSGESKKMLASLPSNQFGEGITIMGDTIFMLTWREGLVHLFDKHSGEKITSKRYGGEGWGLTSDGERLYMSDGSGRITVRDPETFQIIESHNVTMAGRTISRINELEWIDGKIWANIYYTDTIVIIDPKSWVVEGEVDLTGLLPSRDRTPQTDVLNGIAYDRETKKIYVTGKNWSKLFEIEIVER